MLVHEYFPQASAVAEQAESEVRSTVTTVVNDAPSSVADDAPDFNEQILDPETEGGLTAHQTASAVTPSTHYPPTPTPDTGDAIQRTINDGIATKGRAPAVEASGVWGHGTMPIVEGIEPGISAAPFADRYFAALPHAVESTDFMTPGAVDPNDSAVAQAVGVNNAVAAQSPYSALLNW